MNTYYRRNLPHIQPLGSSFFITTRLFGSIPKSELDKIKKWYRTEINQSNFITNVKERNINKFRTRKKYLQYIDNALEENPNGPYYLRKTEIADIVKEQLHRFDGEYYDLIAYTIMSNHVHVLIDTQVQFDNNLSWEGNISTYTQLDKIMQRIKGASARYSNQILGRCGKFWERESYDIYIRHERMLYNVIRYILMNPVKAKFVRNWKDFPHSFVKEGIEMEI